MSPPPPASSSTARPARHRLRAELDDEGAVIGEAEDSPSDFGRIAAFAAKQVINQRLRDIGDDKVLGEFKGREGDIVAGVIQQGPNPRMIHVDLGTIEAILPPEEQVPGEDYAHGSRIRVYVTAREQGPQGSADHGEPHASRRSCASCSRSRCPRSRAGSSRSRRSPARPATAPRWPCARPSPASTPRAPASASSASACAR